MIDFELVKRGKCIFPENCGTSSCCHWCGKLINNRCSIYTNRPEICKLYPRNPMELIEVCGYYFQTTMSGKVVDIFQTNLKDFPYDIKVQWDQLSIQKSIDEENKENTDNNRRMI